jgi:hypothetical protein
VGGKLSGTLPNPGFAGSALGNAAWNPADPLSYANLTGMPIDLASGTSPSLHTLGPAAGQSAPGASLHVRRIVPGWLNPMVFAPVPNTVVASATGSVQWWHGISVERPMTIDQIAFQINAVSAPAGSLYVALVSVDGASTNFTLLSQSTVQSLSGMTTGTKNISLAAAQAVAPGFYAIGIGYVVTAGTLTFNAIYNVGPMTASPGRTGPNFGSYSLYTISGTQGFPASGVITLGGGGGIPWLGYHITAMT